MTVAELVATLRQRGVRLSVEAGRLWVDAPKGTLAPELRKALAEHKAEVLAALEAEQAQPDAERAGKPTGFERADAFFQRHGWAPIRSHTLGGEVVVFLRDEHVAVPERWQEAVTYTREDLAALEGVNPKGLRLIHEAKRVLGGRVLRDGERVRVGEHTVLEGLRTFGSSPSEAVAQGAGAP